MSAFNCLSKMSTANLSYTFKDTGFNRCIDTQLETIFPLNLDRITLKPGGSDLGNLRNIPMEILVPILEDIPLVTLMSFRNSSRRAHYIVDTMHKFRIIVEQAPQALRGTLAVQIKGQTTLLCLFNKLRQQRCDCCRSLGQLLWLPTTKRYCATCIPNLPFLVLENEVQQVFGLQDKDLTSIPKFRLLPATLVDKVHKKTFQIPQGQKFYFGEMLGKKVDNPITCLAWLANDRIHVDKANRRLVDAASSEQPVVLPSHQIPDYARCNAVIVVAPWISNHGAEMGVFCSLCLYTEFQNMLFTSKTFSFHIKNCRVRSTHIEYYSRPLLNPFAPSFSYVRTWGQHLIDSWMG